MEDLWPIDSYSSHTLFSFIDHNFCKIDILNCLHLSIAQFIIGDTSFIIRVMPEHSMSQKFNQTPKIRKYCRAQYLFNNHKTWMAHVKVTIDNNKKLGWLVLTTNINDFVKHFHRKANWKKERLKLKHLPGWITWRSPENTYYYQQWKGKQTPKSWNNPGNSP